MGNDEISYIVREKLLQSLDNSRSSLVNMTESYDDCLTQYQSSMQNAIKEAELYFNHTDLVKIHQKSKRDALAKVRNWSNLSIYCCFKNPKFWIWCHFQQLRKNMRFEISELASIFWNKADGEIEEMLPNFEAENQRKRTIYMVHFVILFLIRLIIFSIFQSNFFDSKIEFLFGMGFSGNLVIASHLGSLVYHIQFWSYHCCFVWK